MPQPSVRGVHLQQDTKKELEVLHRRHYMLVEETTAHMLQCSQLVHPCSLKDLITFNDVEKQ